MKILSSLREGAVAEWALPWAGAEAATLVEVGIVIATDAVQVGAITGATLNGTLAAVSEAQLSALIEAFRTVVYTELTVPQKHVGI